MLSGALESSLDPPKSQCSIGFQPVFVRTSERCFQVSAVSPNFKLEAVGQEEERIEWRNQAVGVSPVAPEKRPRTEDDDHED